MPADLLRVTVGPILAVVAAVAVAVAAAAAPAAVAAVAGRLLRLAGAELPVQTCLRH